MPQRSNYRKCALRECWKSVKPSKFSPWQRFCSRQCQMADATKRRKRRRQEQERAEVAAIVAELRKENYHR